MEAIRSASEEELLTLHTVGERIAHCVSSGLSRKAGLIDELLGYVSLTWPGAAVQVEVPADSPLLGKNILFTGAMQSGFGCLYACISVQSGYRRQGY